MPYLFKFKVNDETTFQCVLQSQQCDGVNNKNGRRCGRRCIIGTPLCATHLMYNMRLKIMPSQVPAVQAFNGKGLFAYDPNLPAGAVVFKKGDVICRYEGEILTDQQIDQRYGDEYTAPYALEEKKNRNIDCSCKRGIGSLCNHSTTQDNVEFRRGYTGRGVQRRNYINVKAKRIIYNRQELLVNYGNEYTFDDDVSHSTKYISNRQADNIN